MLTRGDQDELIFRLKQVFRPGTPINALELFAERRSQSHAILAAIQQNGQHAILFGERGVGKTSLANVLSFFLQRPGWPKLTPIVNCTRSDTYSSLWGRVFSVILDDLQKTELALPAFAKRHMRLAQEGIHDTINMELARRVLSAIAEKALLVVILDEFDTLEDTSVRAAIADTIKYLSDRNSPFTVIMVGVSDDVEHLVADHRSIERCLSQVRMPRMSRDELEQIVKKCLSLITKDGQQMTIERAALHEISRIATGLPHYAHLLGLHAGVQAVESQSLAVSSGHLGAAINTALDSAHQSIQNGFLQATESSQRSAQYREVLIACAMAETNELGYFSPSDVRDPLSRVLKKPAKISNFTRHLHAFCEDQSGPVLKRVAYRNRPQFRFINPLMQPFALMKGLSQGMLTENDLRETRARDVDPAKPGEQQRLF